MIMAIGMGIALIIINILCFVFFIMVLVKLFKNEGALKGILGFFCSIYTFIWGWMKHKQLGMTKLMATWSVLTVVGMVMVPVMGASSALMIPQYIQKMSDNGDIKISQLESSKKTPKINWAKKKQEAKAAAKLGKNNSTNPQNKRDEDWSQKALALWQDGHYKDPNKAINYWNRAIENKQNTAIAYSNRGLAYHDLGQHQLAVNDYNRAIEMNPGYAAAYNNRGNSYYELSEYQMALNDFTQSLKLKPKYAKAYLNRGLAFYQMNKNSEACNDFQKSCDQGDCDGIKWAMKNGVCN
ncbi:MAG: tetratricopeptide repeat protein [Deltaproteobacteria bacterium]|nr:tetratricopeptide repeat protein [Deltaproteobacteria bacterium]